MKFIFQKLPLVALLSVILVMASGCTCECCQSCEPGNCSCPDHRRDDNDTPRRPCPGPRCPNDQETSGHIRMPDGLPSGIAP